MAAVRVDASEVLEKASSFPPNVTWQIVQRACDRYPADVIHATDARMSSMTCYFNRRPKSVSVF